MLKEIDKQAIKSEKEEARKKSKKGLIESVLSKIAARRLGPGIEVEIESDRL